MQRASRYLRVLQAADVTPEQVACSAWARAVGKRIAARTRAVKLVRTKLVVEVEDAVWRSQLFSLSRPILRNLERALGPGLVEELEFRVIPLRREPGRAHLAAPALLVAADEAEGIADPGLRRIYIAARNRDRSRKLA